MHIDRYSKRLLYQHIPYIIALVLCLAFLGIFVPMEIKKAADLDPKIQQLQQQVSDLRKTQTLVDSVQITDVEHLLQIFSVLLPSKEDNLSVISAIETLSSASGLRIVEYSSPFAKQADGTIVVTVKGVGGEPQLRTFLSLLMVGGGRYATLGKVVFHPKRNTIEADITFYTQPDSSLSDESPFNTSAEDIVRLRSIADEYTRLNQNASPTELSIPILQQNPQPFGN